MGAWARNERKKRSLKNEFLSRISRRRRFEDAAFFIGLIILPWAEGAQETGEGPNLAGLNPYLTLTAETAYQTLAWEEQRFVSANSANTVIKALREGYNMAGVYDVRIRYIDLHNAAITVEP